jgi:hypothetical protein
VAISAIPRAYPYLPHKGGGRNYVPLRRALLHRRNVSESINDRLKGRGIGNGGMNIPRWVRTDNEFKWLCYSTLLVFTLQRLAHANWQYAESHREAVERGYLRPAQPHEPSAPSVSEDGGDAAFDSDEPFDFDTLVA